MEKIVQIAGKMQLGDFATEFAHSMAVVGGVPAKVLRMIQDDSEVRYETAV